MKLLTDKDIKPHGSFGLCDCKCDCTKTVFEWRIHFRMPNEYDQILRSEISHADSFCCFGAKNNPNILAKVFNDVHARYLSKRKQQSKKVRKND